MKVFPAYRLDYQQNGKGITNRGNKKTYHFDRFLLKMK